ncbi:MAG: hypothetical protein DMD87_23185 [Candidatus Rokuibacteriota bacterium]|nr:MAG: hypothetical protein DMD87_23185 [Candidatus Rokubacteria bacterium]
MVNAIVRPWTVPLLAIAAFTTPCGVVHSWSCRSSSAIGVGMTTSPDTFQAKSPLATKIWRCSPATGCPPPPRGGFSPCVRTSSSRIDALS